MWSGLAPFPGCQGCCGIVTNGPELINYSDEWILCDESLVQPLSLIFRGCIHTGVYPDGWKKSNIIPVHKKGDKQVVNNCRPVSLLPICSKILEKIVLGSIMRFLNENKLISNAQSGFRPPDSCECQVLLIVHDIYKSFDCNPPLEVRGIFLDIPKAFDRVWHDRLIYKIKSFGISHTPLKLIEHFLSNRYQNLVLKGQSSSWAEVSAGVPQGPILDPLFFLIILTILAVDYHQQLNFLLMIHTFSQWYMMPHNLPMN